MLKKILLTIWHGILIAGAAFIMSSAWHWVQMMHKPRMWILGKILPVAGELFVIFVLFYIIALLLAYRKNLALYQSIKSRAPQALFVFSFIFLSVLGKTEWQCLLGFLALSSFVVYYIQSLFHLSLLPRLWLFFVFFFSLAALIQFAIHYYYILDINFKFTKTIPLLRSFSMALFWLVLLLSIFYLEVRNQKLGKIFKIVFVILFGLYLFFAGINVGVLRGSGLFFTPTALQHTEGAGAVIFTWQTAQILSAIILGLGILIFLLRKVAFGQYLQKKPLYIVIGLWFLTGFMFVLTTKLVQLPGIEVADAFYRHYWGKQQNVELPPQILEKLNKQFGLNYNLDDFYVGKKEKIFNAGEKLLPNKFTNQKPNILIVFLESFSAKLSDVYSNTWGGKLTPALKDFSSDKNTTIFKNYYNSSTPTVTGLLSLLCSFLPPTGHEEIANNNRLTKFYLSCLPNVLDKNGGYKTISYITAVNKNYAHKDSLYTGAGMKEVYGTDELKPIIKENTMAWGFSDHQMFKVLPEFLQKAHSPFLITISTIDTHQPFNLAKDVIQFGDGKSDVLNAFHTTDDALGRFWQWFKASEFAANTIVIMVADHAAFPTAYKQVPQYAEMESQNQITFYDENVFMMYVPDTKLPKIVNTYSSELDVTPTILHLLNINVPNTFEGHSIFDDREKYPNLLGMHELGLYINQLDGSKKRQSLYQLPLNLSKTCDFNETTSSDTQLTLCEYYKFYLWKRQMLEQGRLWMK